MEKEDGRLTKAYEIIDSISSQPALRDECLVYGEHVAIKLRKFNEHRRAILMHKINSLIFEAEMEVYNSQKVFSYQNNYGRYENTCSSSSVSSHVSTPQSSPFPIQPPTAQPVYASEHSSDVSTPQCNTFSVQPPTAQHVYAPEHHPTSNIGEPLSSRYDTAQDLIRNFNV